MAKQVMSMDEEEVLRSINVMKNSAGNVQAYSRVYKDEVDAEYKRSNVPYVGKIAGIAESIKESGDRAVEITAEAEIQTKKFQESFRTINEAEIGGIE